MITVTAVKVTLYEKEQVRGYVTLTIDDSFVVRGIKIIEGSDGRLFTAMPSRKRSDGSFQDLAHPACREARQRIETAVQAEYNKQAGARQLARRWEFVPRDAHLPSSQTALLPGGESARYRVGE